MRTCPGNALPLALMMTMLMLMAGFGLGLVVVEQSKRSIETDQAIQSYYMADAGIENQLYDVRKKNVALSSFASTTQSYVNGGSWFSTTGLVNVSKKDISLIRKDQFAGIDLFDPDSASVTSHVCKLDVTWSDDLATCTPGVNSMLEASYGYWTVDPNLGPQWPTDDQFVVLAKSNQGDLSVFPLPVPFLPMSISGLSPDRAYRIRLKAYNCNAKDVSVQAYTDTGGGCNNTDFAFPGDITLSAQGNYRFASQKITVTMPKQDVLSGVFSYVLFSECTIVKGAGTVTCPP